MRSMIKWWSHFADWAAKEEWDVFSWLLNEVSCIRLYIWLYIEGKCSVLFLLFFTEEYLKTLSNNGEVDIILYFQTYTKAASTLRIGACIMHLQKGCGDFSQLSLL